MWYSTVAAYYPIPETEEAALKVRSEGITLASATPGVLSGERREIRLWATLNSARERHPFSAVAECQVRGDALKSGSESRWRRCDSTNTRQAIAADYHTFGSDIPASAIVTVHPSSRSLAHSAGHGNQPHPLSEEGMLLIETNAYASDLLRKVYKRMVAHMDSAHRGSKRQASGRRAWHEYYKTMPALQNFVAAQKHTLPDAEEIQIVDSAEKEAWIVKLAEAQSQVAMLPMGFNEAYLEGIEGLVLSATNRISASQGASEIQGAMDSIMIAVAKLADHQEMLMGVYAGNQVGSYKTRERAVCDGPVIEDFPKNNW